MADNDEVKTLLKEIRDTQRAHYDDWKRAYAEGLQFREQAAVQIRKAKRARLVLLIVVVLLILLPLIERGCLMAYFRAHQTDKPATPAD